MRSATEASLFVAAEHREDLLVKVLSFKLGSDLEAVEDALEAAKAQTQGHRTGDCDGKS